MATVFLESIWDTFLFQHVKEPTRCREGQVPSLVDLVLWNKELMVTDMQYLPGFGSSDHVLLKFDLTVLWCTYRTF